MGNTVLRLHEHIRPAHPFIRIDVKLGRHAYFSNLLCPELVLPAKIIKSVQRRFDPYIYRPMFQKGLHDQVIFAQIPIQPIPVNTVTDLSPETAVSIQPIQIRLLVNSALLIPHLAETPWAT